MTLRRGDNIAILPTLPPVDLVYLDPPFMSGREYETTAGEEAFADTWKWDDAAAMNRRATHGLCGRTLDLLLDSDLVGDDLALCAYLCFMAARLQAISKIMAPNASFYLHCDPTASHYLKILCDAVFGRDAFRNEIVWRYRRWPAKAKRFQRMHDVLLFYQMGEPHFEALYGYEDLAESTKATFGRKKQRADFSRGKRLPGVDDCESKGPPLSDVWDVSLVAPSGKERNGYPTQKPEALLERVILASSREGGLVLDPFCGSGTTLAVAQRLGRRWIGIDQSPKAIEIASRRLGVVAQVAA